MKMRNSVVSVAIALVVVFGALVLVLGVAGPAFSTATLTAQATPASSPTPPAGDVIPLKPLAGLTSLDATVKLQVNGLVNGKHTQGDLTALVTTNDQKKSQATVSGSLLGTITAQVGGSLVGLFTPSEVDVFKVPQGTYVVVNGVFPVCVKPQAADATKSLDDLSPQALLTMLTSSDVARGKFVGNETLKGAAVKHYVINGDTFVTSAQNSSDPKVRAFGEALWSAKDADLYLDATGGYPVAFNGSYSGSFEPLNFEGDFSVQIELTGVNTNTRVDLPASCNKPISR
ncbi:MAG: hypothetical protein U0822_27560 [Anaerolineae bacterium]